MLIQVEDVSKHYVRPKTTVEVLRGVHLAIAAQEMVAIVGPSGAGKSTLLHLHWRFGSSDAGCDTLLWS